MQRVKSYNFLVIGVLIAILFTGCESNFKEVSRMSFSEFTPSFVAEDFDMKYTDSGRISTVLKSKRMMEYGTVEFPFTEFPEGVHVTFYDPAGKRTYVRSDYAISYKGTEVIDLRGKVKIWADAGQTLETEQLYFDQKANWFYTEEKFKFSDPKGVSYGEGIDFSRDFKIVNSQQIRGAIDKGEM